MGYCALGLFGLLAKTKIQANSMQIPTVIAVLPTFSSLCLIAPLDHSRNLTAADRKIF
jgi:hypothetical protein